MTDWCGFSASLKGELAVKHRGGGPIHYSIQGPTGGTTSTLVHSTRGRITTQDSIRSALRGIPALVEMKIRSCCTLAASPVQFPQKFFKRRPRETDRNSTAM